jgi:pimeloyl-ACP methyl ester carboxylesterase
VGTIATLEAGTGPAVLLVHGLNGFKEGWGPLPGALAAAGLRAVTVDLPGFGASRRLGRGRSGPESLARALEPLVLALAPVALVAHSLGTQIAMVLAARHRDAVRRVALISPWVLARPMRLPPRSVSDLVQIPLVGPALARLAIARIRRDPERRRDAYLTAVADPASLTGDPEMAALLQEASDRLATADLRAMADWASLGLATDVRPLAARIPQPALVVAGTEDRVTRPAGAEWLAHALPAGRLLRIPGIGHFPHLEEPATVLPAVVGHLG